MKLKPDENVGRRGSERLRRAGHDVATVADQGLAGASDRTLATRCAAENRALVTLDLDFANPLRFDPAAYAGIAVLRLPAPALPADLAAAVDTLARALQRRAPTGQLRLLERNRIRQYDRDES